MASGLYVTPHVGGGGVDIARGVNGSLRANTVPGQAVSLSNPTTLEWFNTAAFCSASLTATCANPSGSVYGDAGRNIIEGPGQITVNMVLSKTIQVAESKALELRLQANNVFNTTQFTAINTTVNSLTYGEVTSVANMRRVTMIARFRF